MLTELLLLGGAVLLGKTAIEHPEETKQFAQKINQTNYDNAKRKFDQAELDYKRGKISFEEYDRITQSSLEVMNRSIENAEKFNNR